MRYVGIDYGKKRIGLALSDPEGRMGFPFRTVGTLAEVLEVIRQGEVGAVVIGLPLDAQGREAAQARVVRAFADRLRRAVKLPVAFENELFTTKIAERHTEADKADASAAALILQSYLDRVK